MSTLSFIIIVTNQIHGTIPSEIGLLHKIRHLDIGSNQVDGSLPTELGNLNNLRVLALGDNLLTGTLPSELGNLDNLKHLSLSKCNDAEPSILIYCLLSTTNCF